MSRSTAIPTEGCGSNCNVGLVLAWPQPRQSANEGTVDAIRAVVSLAQVRLIRAVTAESTATYFGTLTRVRPELRALLTQVSAVRADLLYSTASPVPGQPNGNDKMACPVVISIHVGLRHTSATERPKSWRQRLDWPEQKANGLWRPAPEFCFGL